MTFVSGFLIWIAIGVVASLVVRAVYRGPTTTLPLTIYFGLAGTFIGGMLGTSAYVTHDPTPLRFGALLGAALGGAFFPFVYHLVARKAL